jgi:YidC/Oxa1 family membrane protein insertase
LAWPEIERRGFTFLDRNTLLAFALSMMVFVTFLMYQERQYADVALEAQNQAEQAAEAERAGEIEGDRAFARETAEVVVREAVDRGPVEALPSRVPARNLPIKKTILQNENVIAEISNDSGLISSWRLKRYDERLPEGDEPIELISEGFPALATEMGGVSGANFLRTRFEVLHSTDREVLQRAENEAGVLTRKIRLDDRGYGFDLELTFESHRADPVDASFELLWPSEMSDRPDFRELALVAYSESDGVTRTPVVSAGQPGFLGFGGGENGVEKITTTSVWAGTDLRYFAGLVIDPNTRGGFDVQFESLEEGESALARIKTRSSAIGAGGSVAQNLRGYIGPKLIDELADAGSGLESSINRGYSWLEPLVRLFEIALDKLYIVIPNYGLAIIVLTILVRLVVSPLMVRQMRSAEKMRMVQPKVKALQEKFKDDRQKQSEEMMKLWKEEGINPLGGCLPLLFQFPVLIGLFFALQSSIGLRHAPFALWINDLSQPATLFVMPGLDFPIRILPLIMAGSMFLQQKMTPTTGMDPAQAKMMLVMMPGMMLLFSYTFPSGLVLYWTVSNILGIAHQYWIRNKMQPAS